MNVSEMLEAMGILSKTGQKILFQAHPDLQILFVYVVRDFDCTIVCSYRTKEKQHEYFLAGLSKVDYPTCHNTKPSIAIDAVPYINGKPTWEGKQALAFSMYVKGRADQLYKDGIMKHKIRIGSDWDGDFNVNDQTFNDYGHFELILSQEEKEKLEYFET